MIQLSRGAVASIPSGFTKYSQRSFSTPTAATAEPGTIQDKNETTSAQVRISFDLFISNVLEKFSKYWHEPAVSLAASASRQRIRVIRVSNLRSSAKIWG